MVENMHADKHGHIPTFVHYLEPHDCKKLCQQDSPTNHAFADSDLAGCDFQEIYIVK